MIIEVEDLQKTYGKTEALRGINFSVPEKQIVGFLGPNGAGKSTTIGILMQMIRADAGNAYLFGEDVRLHGPSVRKRVGLIPDAALPNISGQQLLKHTGWHLGHSGSELREQIIRVIDLIGGSSFYARNTKTMSKGQRQRIKIANALLSDPELIIADEPTAGLDPVSRQTLLKLFSELVNDQGKTVFFSNHVISEVEKVSDHLIILNQGEIQTMGSMEDIKARMAIPGMYRLDVKNIGEDQLRALSGVELVRMVSPHSFLIRTVEEENNIPQFLKELVEQDIRIEHFSRKLLELEEIFTEGSP